MPVRLRASSPNATEVPAAVNRGAALVLTAPENVFSQAILAMSRSLLGETRPSAVESPPGGERSLARAVRGLASGLPAGGKRRRPDMAEGQA